MSVSLELLGPERGRPLAGQLRDLYAEVYAEPPYCEGPELVERFARHLEDEWQRPGFAMVAALDGARLDGGRLVGAAYGWMMPAGRWFRNATEEPPAEIRDADKFAVMEWMVRPAHRRAGIGRLILDRLLAGRPEPWAILAANPHAPAREIYRRLGWQPCGHTEPDVLPRMDVLALDLRGKSRLGGPP